MFIGWNYDDLIKKNWKITEFLELYFRRQVLTKKHELLLCIIYIRIWKLFEFALLYSDNL